jgi:hypothetical protein
MGCYRTNTHQNRNQQVRTKEAIFKIKKPETNFTVKDPRIIVLFFISNTNYCDDPNKHVDYIIGWLIEDGVRCEKYDINNVFSSKYSISKTPSIVIQKETIKVYIDWKGIVLTYKEIVRLINLM